MSYNAPMLTFVPAQNSEDHFALFLKLEEQFYQHYSSIGIGEQYGRLTFDQIPVELTRSEFDRYCTGDGHPKSYFMFAFDGATCVGYYNGWIKEKSGWYRMREIAHLESLIVAAEHRGKGYSTLMAKDFFAWARTKGVTICQLEVWAKNVDAIDIYKKWGFEIDELIMWKKIA
jgi:GNAT superfamily N-acetyltransferase